MAIRGSKTPQVQGRQEQVQAMKAEQQAQDLKTEATSTSAGEWLTQRWENRNVPTRARTRAWELQDCPSLETGMGVSSQGEGKADPKEGIWGQGSACSLQEHSQEAGPSSRLCLHVSLGTMSTF